jgi:hypothetical protein
MVYDYTIPTGLERLNLSTFGGATLKGNGLDNDIRVRRLEGATIDAGDGDDHIEVGSEGGRGGTILGGEGNDYLRVSTEDVFIDGGAGNDQFVLDGQYGNEGATDQTVVSGSGNDSLTVLDYDVYWNGTSTTHLVEPESFDSIFVGDGANLIVEAGATPEANPLRVHRLVVSNFFGDPPGLIDLNDNPLIASDVGWFDQPNPGRGDTDTLLALGRNGSTWGKGGIRSSLVDTHAGMVLGVAQASELFTSFPATFAGHALEPADVIVRYTRAGDANLDRKVDFADLVIVSQHYNQADRTYAQGNLNYSDDGTVDFADLVLLSQNYGTSMPAATIVASSSAKKAGKSVAKDVLR